MSYSVSGMHICNCFECLIWNPNLKHRHQKRCRNLNVESLATSNGSTAFSNKCRLLQITTSLIRLFLKYKMYFLHIVLNVSFFTGHTSPHFNTVYPWHSHKAHLLTSLFKKYKTENTCFTCGLHHQIKLCFCLSGQWSNLTHFAFFWRNKKLISKC